MVQASIKWLDALKLFAIFLVLWGHAVQHLLSSEYWTSRSIASYIHSICRSL